MDVEGKKYLFTKGGLPLLPILKLEEIDNKELFFESVTSGFPLLLDFLQRGFTVVACG